MVAEPWGLSTYVLRSIQIVLVAGFFATLVLAWYHGEKGRQRVGGVELLILASVLGVAGLAISKLERSPPGALEAEPVDVLLESGPLSAAALAAPSIAVLPFGNLGGEGNQDFVDGMHEEVLHSLSQLSGLIVKSRQSVLQYRGSEQTIAAIAEELDADAVMEGSVRSAGDRVRVTVQLIDARTDAHLWSRTFDELLEAGRIFAIQEAVAREIATTLRVTLTPQEHSRLASRATESLDVQTVFLKAQAAERGSEERNRLIGMAIAMDSTYDRPWGLLASDLAFTVLREGKPELGDSALALAQKAISLNPATGQYAPFRAMGVVHFSRGRLAEARAAFGEGLRRDPNSSNGNNNLGVMLEAEGRYPEAVAAYQRQIGVTPGTLVARANLAELFAVMGLADKATRLLEEVEVLDPDRGGGYTSAYLGDPKSGLDRLEVAIAKGPRTGQDVFRVAALLATWAGNLETARSWAQKAHDLNADALPIEESGHTSRVTLGYLALLDGESAAAAALLDDAYDLIEPLVTDGWELYALPLELATIASPPPLAAVRVGSLPSAQPRSSPIRIPLRNG